MVKASLRSSIKTPHAVVVDNGPVEVLGVKVESRTTACAPSSDLADILPGSETSQQEAPALPVARRASGAVSVPRDHQFNSEGFEGDWGAEDLKFPQLKLVQGSGPLSTQFDAGTVIYGELELLPPPSVKPDAKNPSIRFVPISITKQWREKLSQDQVAAGDMPRIAQTVSEVEELGGTVRWVGNQMPDNLWEPSARCMFLVELPEGSDHPGFALELDGKFYAVAVYYAAGGAFRDSAKIIFNTAQTSLLVPVLDENKQPVKTDRGQIVKKKMLWKNYWTLNFAKKQAGNFTPWRPIVKLLAKEETGPDVRAYIESLVGDSTEAAAAE